MNNKILWVCESAIMIALATVLSLVAIIKMPYGGSVTACSMLPIILIAYRYGVSRGLVAGIIYAFIQMLLDTSVFSTATSAGAAVAIVLFDYILAFGFLGLAGLFRNKIASQTKGIISGALIAIVFRYIMHVISGCTVWAGVSIPSDDGLLYSLIYNAAYMIPEAIVTLVAAWYVSINIDLRSERIGRSTEKNVKVLPMVLTSLSMLFFATGVVYSFAKFFSAIQTESSFDIAKLTSGNISKIIIVLLASAFISAILFIASKLVSKKR